MVFKMSIINEKEINITFSCYYAGCKQTHFIKYLTDSLLYSGEPFWPILSLLSFYYIPPDICDACLHFCFCQENSVLDFFHQEDSKAKSKRKTEHWSKFLSEVKILVRGRQRFVASLAFHNHAINYQVFLIKQKNLYIFSAWR